MTERDTRFDSYIEYLSLLAQTPDSADEASRTARATHQRSVSFADRAEAEAEDFAATGRRRIEESLAEAREVLASHGEERLVPPRIRPSAVPKAATRADVEFAIDGLRAATRTLSRWTPPAPAFTTPSASMPIAPVMETPAPSLAAQPRGRRRVLIAIGVAVVVVAAILVFAAIR